MGRVWRWVMAAVVVVGLLVAVDRGAAYVASRAVADRIRATEQLSGRPGVDIGGFPFLTQVVGGRYDDVRVTFTGLVRGGLRVARLLVELHGARVPLRAIVGGHVDGVRVDHGSAVLFITYPDLEVSLRAQPLMVRYGGTPGKVLLSVDGLSADTSLVVSGSTLSAVVSTGGAGSLHFSRTLSRLPFGIQLTQATSSPQGITITASATSFTIPA